MKQLEARKRSIRKIPRVLETKATRTLMKNVPPRRVNSHWFVQAVTRVKQ